MEHFKRNRLSCLLKINRQQKISNCKRYSSLEDTPQKIDNSNLLTYPSQHKCRSNSTNSSINTGNQLQHNLSNNNNDKDGGSTKDGSGTKDGGNTNNNNEN